jgi:hypothetical protein
MRKRLDWYDIEEETYKLEITIFTNFKGTEEEAIAKLEEDLNGFKSGDAGWFSDNYMPSDQMKHPQYVQQEISDPVLRARQAERDARQVKKILNKPTYLTDAGGKYPKDRKKMIDVIIDNMENHNIIATAHEWWDPINKDDNPIDFAMSTHHRKEHEEYITFLEILRKEVVKNGII